MWLSSCLVDRPASCSVTINMFAYNTTIRTLLNQTCMYGNMYMYLYDLSRPIIEVDLTVDLAVKLAVDLAMDLSVDVEVNKTMAIAMTRSGGERHDWQWE